MDTRIHEQVSEYYGKILKGSEDLKTNACCTSSAPPKYVREILPMTPGIAFYSSSADVELLKKVDQMCKKYFLENER